VDLLVAHARHVLLARVALDRLRPVLEELARRGIERRLLLRDDLGQPIGGFAALLEERARDAKRLALALYARLRRDVLVVSAHAVGDLGEIARALGRHDGAVPRRRFRLNQRELARLCREALLLQRREDRLVERGDAVVVEAARLRAVDGHIVWAFREELAIALVLLAHVA